MAAAQKLLINTFVTASTVCRSQVCGDHKTVMIVSLLVFRRCVTLQAAYGLAGMSAHLVFVNYRILLLRVTLSAFTGGPYKRCVRLVRFDRRPLAIHQKCADNQREGDYNSDKNRSKWHGLEAILPIQSNRRGSNPLRDRSQSLNISKWAQLTHSLAHTQGSWAGRRSREVPRGTFCGRVQTAPVLR